MLPVILPAVSVSFECITGIATKCTLLTLLEISGTRQLLQLVGTFVKDNINNNVNRPYLLVEVSIHDYDINTCPSSSDSDSDSNSNF